MASRYFDMGALESTPLTKAPFQHLVVPGFVRPVACTEINRDFRSVESAPKTNTRIAITANVYGRARLG